MRRRSPPAPTPAPRSGHLPRPRGSASGSSPPGGIGGVHRRLTGRTASRSTSPATSPSWRDAGLRGAAPGPRPSSTCPPPPRCSRPLACRSWASRTGELPAFYSAAGGVSLEHRVEDAPGRRALLRLHWEGWGAEGVALLAATPPRALPRAEVEAAWRARSSRGAPARIAGQGGDPCLLAAVARATGEGGRREAQPPLAGENARGGGRGGRGVRGERPARPGRVPA